MPGWPMYTCACAESNGIRRSLACCSGCTSGTTAWGEHAVCGRRASRRCTSVSACARVTAPTTLTLVRQGRMLRLYSACMSATLIRAQVSGVDSKPYGWLPYTAALYARPACTAGRVLASFHDAVIRARSRSQMSAAKAGSPSWRAAKVMARSSRSGSVRVRSEKLIRSALALASNDAPKSAQASPSAFSSSAGKPPTARTPLVAKPAVTLASPAWATGSRRLPASTSICTSRMGMDGLSTRYTCAPLGCVQCWIGSAAKTF